MAVTDVMAVSAVPPCVGPFAGVFVDGNRGRWGLDSSTGTPGRGDPGWVAGLDEAWVLFRG